MKSLKIARSRDISYYFRNRTESIEEDVITTPWERLSRIIQLSGLTTNAFALIIGLRRGENLYQIKRGKNGISLSLILKITSAYPNVSKAWLMFGEGNMLKFGKLPLYDGVPFYDNEEDVFQILSTPFDKLKAPTFTVTAPNRDKSDIIIRTRDPSLEPSIQIGSVLLFQNTDIQDIVSGIQYMIVTDTKCFLSVIDVDSNLKRSDFVLAKTSNPTTTNYINKADIKRLYLVVVLKIGSQNI